LSFDIYLLFEICNLEFKAGVTKKNNNLIMKMILIKNNKLNQSGISIVYTVIVIFIFSLVMLSALQYATNELRVLRATANREEAFQIAEAGANYYEWHLAHYPSDFWDGNASTTPGPYSHTYTDLDNETAIGRFQLTITPTTTGSSIVTVKSVGFTFAAPNTKRTITVQYGIPSLAKYSFLTNSDVWIGSDEHISGQMHSNGGIHFDGTGNAPITSAKSNIPPGPGYQCYPMYNCSSPYQNKPGIWGAALASTQAFWQMAVPNVDFSSMTSDLATLKSLAQTDGAPAYLSASNKYGYDLVFNGNGTVNIYIVKGLLAAPSQAWDINGHAVSTSIDYDQTQLQLLYNQAAIPAHGVFYIEDNVWVEGKVHGRAQVVAAKLPYSSAAAPDIYIPNNICYTQTVCSNRDTTSSLGLLSQQDIVVTYNAPQDLEIDAAMIAQNGSVQVYEYPNYQNVKNSITVYGSLGTYGPWTWTYVSGNTPVSGFANTYTTYDSSLLYAPPPNFPQSTDGYQQINWGSD
jgi:type II secretory pathway pseudopilin PulG